MVQLPRGGRHATPRAGGGPPLSTGIGFRGPVQYVAAIRHLATRDRSVRPSILEATDDARLAMHHLGGTLYHGVGHFFGDVTSVTGHTGTHS